MPSRKIIIATRGSALALKQAQIVAELLSERHPGVEFSIAVVKTRGNRILEVPLRTIPGKGVFVKEVEERLLRGQASVAVHSMKDLPIEIPSGLCLAAVPERDDPRDVLISRDGLPLKRLRSGAVIGTSSPRRKAQLLACRPELRVESIRGNLDTRIAKLRGTRLSAVRYDAIVVAAAGCQRAGYENEITEYLSAEMVLPAPGQGAIAVECREDDREAIEMARSINDPASFVAVEAERALLKYLGGGCHTPIAALAAVEGGNLWLRGAILSPDGSRIVRAESYGPPNQPDSLATEVAQRLLLNGARELLR